MKQISLFKILSGPVKYMEPDGRAMGYNMLTRFLFRPSVIASSFAAASLSVLYPQLEGKEIVKDALFGYAVSRLTRKILMPNNWKDFDYKIISTMPTRNEIEDGEKYRETAHRKSRHEFNILAFASMTYISRMESALASPSATAYVTLLFAPLLADLSASAYEFRRVAAGKSAMVDYPAIGTYLDHLQTKNGGKEPPPPLNQ